MHRGRRRALATPAPRGTEGVGPCAGGTQTCNSNGTGWGDCTGQTLPGQEGGACTDGVDNDCNGKIDCADVACASAAACCTNDPNPPDGTIWANSEDTLYRVDPSTFATTRVGGFAISDQMTDVAVTPGGQLYGVSFTSLYSINKVSGAATFIASVPGNGNNSLTFLPSGDLIAADGGGNLKRIDPSTGQVTPIGSYGNGLASAGDLVGVKSGVLYGTSSTTPGGGSAANNNHLIRVDPTTGVASDGRSARPASPTSGASPTAARTSSASRRRARSCASIRRRAPPRASVSRASSSGEQASHRSSPTTPVRDRRFYAGTGELDACS